MLLSAVPADINSRTMELPAADDLELRGPLVNIQKLACQLAEAYGSGHVSPATAQALGELFVGVKLFSISVVLEGGVIVEVGSMARQGYPRLSILPAAQAAAHLAVEQNSWLHMVCQDSGFWFPGWARPVGFTDLAEAADLYKCKSVLFVPIPGLPAQEASKISTSGEVREAPMGVISLGLDEKLPFDDKLLMDALILGCALSDYLPADAVSVLQRIYDIFADLDELAELSARRTISQEDVAGSLQEPFEFDRRECEECPSESELSCRRSSLPSCSSGPHSQARSHLAAAPADVPQPSGITPSPFAGLPEFDSESESEDEVDKSLQTAVRDAVRFSFDTNSHGFGRMNRDSAQSRSAQLADAVTQSVTQLATAKRSISGSLADHQATAAMRTSPPPRRSFSSNLDRPDHAASSKRRTTDAWFPTANPHARRSASDPVADMAPMRDLKAPIRPGYLTSSLYRSSSGDSGKATSVQSLPYQPSQQPIQSDVRSNSFTARTSPKRGAVMRRQGTPERNSYDSDIVMARHTVAGDVDPAASIAEPAGRAAQHSVSPGHASRFAQAAAASPSGRTPAAAGSPGREAALHRPARPAASAELTAEAAAALAGSATPAAKFRHAQMLLCPVATVDMARLSSIDREGLHAAAAPLQINLESAKAAAASAASVAASLKSNSCNSSRSNSPFPSRTSSPSRQPRASASASAAEQPAQRSRPSPSCDPGNRSSTTLTAANLVARGVAFSDLAPPRRSSLSIGARWAAYRARKAAAAEKGHRESVDSFDSMASSVSSGSLEVNPTAQSPVWLAFRNPRLEKSFRMWHTAQRMTVDAVLIVLACALYITCGYLVPAVQLGRHAPFSYPLAIVALLAPAALMQAGQYKYQRRREELMTCLCTFLTAHTAFVVVPSLMAMLPDTCAGDALPARMTCSLVRLLVSLSLCATGAGSLIRFRRFLPMQILNSAITALSLPCMCAWATSGQAEGFSKYLNCGIVAQTLLGLVAPSVAVWGLEKLARQAFLRMPMAQFATKQQ